MSGRRSPFEDLGLRAVVVHALRRKGVEKPFPIQSAAIPDALDGADILGRAPTGSGKTLAFGLPVLQRMSGAISRPGRPRALILVPTRELALQIEQSLDETALALGVRMATVVGGAPVRRQVEKLERAVDVVVATPGRLEDLVERGDVHLGEVVITVVDEADRMADLGFLPQVVSLLDRTPADGQRMLFSATLDGDVDELVLRYLRSPITHSVDSPAAEKDNAQHHFFQVTNGDKEAVVSAIAAREGRTILFLRTKFAVDRLTDHLRAVGIDAAALHGGKTQANRIHILASFEDGTVPVLVSTDVMARGIHVDSVSLVVHVDPPADAKDYTHRAGRTARAGASGTVVTLATETQVIAVTETAQEAGISAHFVPVTHDDRVLIAITGARTSPARGRQPTTTQPPRPGHASSERNTSDRGRPRRPTRAGKTERRAGRGRRR